MRNITIGLDIGGTNLRIGAVTRDHQVLTRKIIGSDSISKAADPIDELSRLIEQFIAENHYENIKAVSLGLPSSVANDNETVICTKKKKNRSGQPIFQNTNVAGYLRDRLKLPVYVNNDTSNILLYDISSNGLQNRKVVIGIYIGTGVGASVLIDGKLLKGANGAALDLGHIPYFRGTEPCSCSKHGCCECYASGWKLQKIRSACYPEEDIQNLFARHGSEAPLQEFVYSCSHVFSVMATIFNPDAIIAGGGVIEMDGFPREQFEKMVNENTGLDVMKYGFDYIYSKPNADKGIVGAAIFADRMMAG